VSAAVWLMQMSLFGGWLPAIVAVVAWGALALGVAWWRRAAWHWMVVAGGALVTSLIVADIVARGLGSTYPRSFILWGAMPVFALGAAIWQWRLVAWWRTTVALLAVPALAGFGALEINAYYAYLPTVGDLLGAPFPGQVAVRQLDGRAAPLGTGTPSAALIARKSRLGVVTEIDIPATLSRFHHRPAWVWLPPSYFTRAQSQLPVLMLLSGTPGSPADWLRGDGALKVANAWALAHHGNAPIMVFPDPNGSFLSDTECVDGSRGQAETYLTVDVPAFLRARFDVSMTPRHWAIAGLSEGGTCALDLVARHPDRFSTFADFSGDRAPTLGSQYATLHALYGGSRRDQLAHDPTSWFALDAAAGVAGYIAVGSHDHGSLASQRFLADAARHDQMQIRIDIIPGAGHNFRTWTHALRDAYPWIVNRLNQTP
jgi:S-formylglutathione hydrolase FrmB